MKVLSMETAVSRFPNMVVVLKCMAPLVRDCTAKVYCDPGVYGDAATLYFDTTVSYEKLFDYYFDSVPDYIKMDDLACAGVSHIASMKGPVIKQCIDVTSVAKSLWGV